MRPAQKATPVISQLRVTTVGYTSRKQPLGTPVAFNGTRNFRYVLSLPTPWTIHLCPQPNSAETTRGPPRMDPPFFC